jgi:hypothetical protein
LAAIGPGLIAGAIVILVLGLVLAPLIMRRQIAQSFPKDRSAAIYGWRRMTIDQARILQETELIVTGCKWQAVERIEVSSHLLLFYIAQSAALIVPRRAFTTEAALQEFVDAAERYRKAADGPSRV